MPPFLGGRTEFTARELALAKTISAGRIHVERAIRRLREFRILGRIIPSTLMPVCGDMIRTCAFLINFQDPYIPAEKDDDSGYCDEDILTM
ncbi:Neopullulanase [Frankliniella fusca]|uniref:Neopullulanase n=1 Tax=Frankliniella fusca TaxID=407009 RepID=A0AAE1GYE1_9NEOP|nr:Neopullulanase [Frankliniella fusca]